MTVDIVPSRNHIMHVAFRCDASVEIGSGHVMRCLTLAGTLHEYGARCTFLTRNQPGNLNTRIKQRGHALEVLGGEPSQTHSSGPGEGPYAQWLGVSAMQDARQSRAVIDAIAPDLVVVDHYALDRVWHEEATADAPVIAIDDLADRPHACAVLLDQNFGRLAGDYERLVPPSATILIGPSYALLRPEFAKARNVSLARRRADPELRRLVISMGGTDSENSTGRILEVLAESDLPDQLAVVIIMGRDAPHMDLVGQLAKSIPRSTTVLSDVTDMASLLSVTDLAIGAAGGSVWERCCLGVPSLLLNIADNQRPAARALGEAGVASVLGDFGVGDWKAELRAALRRLSNPDALIAMSEKASALVDGQGAARVADKIMALCENIGVE